MCKFWKHTHKRCGSWFKLLPENLASNETTARLRVAQDIHFFLCQGEKTSAWSSYGIRPKYSRKLVPGTDKPSGSENTREWQDSPKSLEDCTWAWKDTNGTNKAIWKMVSRIWAGPSVPTVSNLWPIYKPVINPWLGSKYRILFLLAQSYEQIKVSENGDMTFIIHSFLPGYLCSSHRREQGWRAIGGRSDPKGRSPSSLKGATGAWRLGERERGLSVQRALTSWVLESEAKEPDTKWLKNSSF